MMKNGYGTKAYVQVPFRKLKGGPVDDLDDDRQRWRWLRFYALSDVKTFPGLVGAIGEPLKGLEIVGAAYVDGEEVRGGPLADSIRTWDSDIRKFVEVGLVKECFLENKRYYWNVDFHVDQDFDSKQARHRRLTNRYYNAFLELSDRERAIFLLLLAEFRPQKVNLEPFGIPAVTRILSEFIVRKGEEETKRLDCDGVRRLGILMDKSVKSVRAFVKADRQEQGIDGYADFVDYFVKEKYEKIRGRKYHFTAKDGVLVKRVLKTFGLEESKRLVDLFFASKDRFICRSGYSIGAFSSVVNSLGKSRVRYIGNFDIQEG